MLHKRHWTSERRNKMVFENALLNNGTGGFLNKVVTTCGEKLRGVADFAMENFSDIKFSREDYARAYDVSPEDVTKLELLDDILRHFDTNEIAKNNPEVASTTWKTASVIAGLACTYAAIPAAIVNMLPDRHAAKVVEYSGILDPSHLIRKGISTVTKKNQATDIIDVQFSYCQ